MKLRTPLLFTKASHASWWECWRKNILLGNKKETPCVNKHVIGEGERLFTLMLF